jgi:hypothetical protein
VGSLEMRQADEANGAREAQSLACGCPQEEREEKGMTLASKRIHLGD